MTATVEPAAPVEAQPRAALDRAEGIELLGDVHGSGYKEGAALVRRADGQIVQLGPLMYALLECADGACDTEELAAELSERVGRRVDEEHVVRLAEKLAAQGLLAGTEHKAPPPRNPLLALRWKVLVTNPKVTKRLTAPLTFLFRPWILWPVLACFVGVCWFVLFDKGLASAAAQAFDSPELLLLVFALAIASAGFHELGHAAACRYGGATPSGMGMGLYMVWPAFYTDVTDAYRLPRNDRLRVDLGGLYFNAIVAVVTTGVWLAWRVDALLLLVALQLVQMVKQLSPVLRSDGYHVLADTTGIPDLYSHIGPTLRRLVPGRHREPSALTGRARILVTLWVLVVVPVLLSMALGAVLLLPRLAASTWESGRHIAAEMPHQAGDAAIFDLLASGVRLLALLLPVLGTVFVIQQLARSFGGKALSWSDGSHVRRAALAAVATAAVCGVAWAWWPAGQYTPIRANENGTLAGFAQFLSAPGPAARSNAHASPVRLTPGKHLAVSMIPVGGATKEHPALFVIAGDDGEPAIAIISESAPEPEAEANTTTTPADSPATDPVQATAFPFELPDAPGPGDTQAVAVGTKDGGVTYKIAYALVTVSKGAPVTNTNSAFAFASCKACTTVAVSFQVVLIIGTSNRIAPINAAGALNVNCPACITTAIADQIVFTLTKQPTDELVQRIQAALKRLDAVPSLGSPAAIADAVESVQKQIETELKDSGLVANKTATTSTPTTTTTPAAATTTAPAETATTPTTTAQSTTTAPAQTTTTASTTTTTTGTTTTTETATTETTGTTAG